MPSRLRQLATGGLANLAIRGATLLCRFALSFYVVSMLGLRAAGVFGLALGAIGILPAAVGWGLNYFLSRDVVGLAPDQAMPLIRARLTVTIGSLALVTAVALAVVAIAPGLASTDATTLALIIALLWFETLGLDSYMALIGLELAFQANLIVFVRSALWIPPLILVGLVAPATRTLDMIFASWVASHILSLGLLAYCLRHWPVIQGWRQPLAVPRTLAARLRQSWFIYFSDLGLVGLIYVDRFVVSAVLGLAATGIYSFYWSITNALQTLVSTAIVQVALPRLFRAHRDDSPAAWRALLVREVGRTLLYAGVLSVVLFVATEAIVALKPGRFPPARLLLVLLLLAAVVRAGSDMLNVGITSTRRDRAYAITNVIGMVTAVLLSLILLKTVGLIGAGVSALLTALGLFVIRAGYLWRVAVMPDAASPVAASETGRPSSA